MKRYVLVLTVLAAAASLGWAQASSVAADVMGAHLNYGRGCAACHAPHSGAAGNGVAAEPDPESGTNALWGEDVTGLYGMTIRTGGSGFVETLPPDPSAGTPDVMGVLACLSCHDGNIASRTV